MAKGELMSLRAETKRFSRFIGRFIERNRNQTAEEALLALGIHLLGKIVLHNPVDTGLSRAGWSAAGEMLGVPVPQGRIGGDPPPKTVLEGPIRISAKHKGEAKLDKNGARVTLTLTNGVEYTIDLEYGSSTQAPFGMVRISMREVEEELGGGQAIPQAIRQIYVDTWDATGADRESQIRAGQIMRALGLSRGANAGAA